MPRSSFRLRWSTGCGTGPAIARGCCSRTVAGCAASAAWRSRAPLRAARETADALAFDGLADCARRELRASGESSLHRTPDARDRLTPQELQIAQLAADGLSNREIGQRLYLSHRTVGSHLYRIFPKLGIAARGQIAQALARPAQRSGEHAVAR